MSLIMNESNFQHILRVLNTNLDGKVKVMFALTSIKGVGRRFSNIACKKAEVDLNKRCGQPPRRSPRAPGRARPPFCCTTTGAAAVRSCLLPRCAVAALAYTSNCVHHTSGRAS